MNDSDHDQLSRKDKLSRSSRFSNNKAEEHHVEETLQLSDEHQIETDGHPQHAKTETSKSSPVLKTVFWLLRKLIAPIIMVIMLAVGLYIGYAVVAGQPSDEVFKFETWKHLWDLIFADS